MKVLGKILSCIMLITLVSACVPTNNVTIDTSNITMGGTLTNGSDFSDEDREMIETLLEMKVLSLDAEGRFNPDEPMGTSEINIALVNFIKGINEKNALAFPVDNAPQVVGDKKFKTSKVSLGISAMAANIKSESTTNGEVCKAIEDYMVSINQDEILSAIMQGKIKVSLPRFDWKDNHLLKKLEEMNINVSANITKAYFLAIIKNWYQDINNWTLEYTLRLNGTGNYSAMYALYDGKSYYYIAPYSVPDTVTGSTKTVYGIFKEENGHAQELVVLQGGGENMFSYGDHIYYTEGSGTKNIDSVFYRVNKSGNKAKERLAYNISNVYVDASATTGKSTLYYKKTDTGDDKIFSVPLDKIHSEKTFTDNSTLVYEEKLEMSFIKDGYIYSEWLYNEDKYRVVGKVNIKNKEKTFIYNDKLIEDVADIKLADDNLFILEQNSMGQKMGGDSIIKVRNEANGHCETILDGVPKAWGSMDDRFNINRLNPYNGYIYFFRRPYQSSSAVLCRVDYNGEEAADIATINSSIPKLSFALAGDYVFALNTNTSPAYKESFRININDGSVSNSFLASDVEYITTDTSSYDIFINAGGIKGAQGQVVENLFFAHGEYKEILYIDLDRNGQEEMVVVYNHENDGAIDVFAIIDNKVQNVQTFLGGNKLMNYALEQKDKEYYIKGVQGVSGGSYYTIHKFNGKTFEQVDSYSHDHSEFLVKNQAATATDYNNKLDEYNNRCIATTNVQFTETKDSMKVDPSAFTETPAPAGPACPSCGSTNTAINPNTGYYKCNNCGVEDSPENADAERCPSCGSVNRFSDPNSGAEVCRDCGHAEMPHYSKSEAKSIYEGTAAELEKYAEDRMKIAATQQQMNSESANIYNRWDDLLNEIYQYLKTSMSRSEFSRLQTEQIQWIKEKEAAVEAAGKEYAGGSMEPMQKNSVAADYTRKRCYYLISLIK